MSYVAAAQRRYQDFRPKDADETVERWLREVYARLAEEVRDEKMTVLMHPVDLTFLQDAASGLVRVRWNYREKKERLGEFGAYALHSDPGQTASHIGAEARTGMKWTACLHTGTISFGGECASNECLVIEVSQR